MNEMISRVRSFSKISTIPVRQRRESNSPTVYTDPTLYGDRTSFVLYAALLGFENHIYILRQERATTDDR
jgi:hypothetical protein